jgi:polar amino acid transport system substrate-binding protein
LFKLKKKDVQKVKTTITFLAMLALLAGPVSAAEQTVTILGDAEYTPYIFKDGGENKGLYVEILEAASARMEGYKIEFLMLPWRRALTDIENGDALAITPPYKRLEARPWIDPYSEPFSTESVVVVCNKNTADTLQGASYPKGYAGKVFGMNTSFEIGGDEFQAMAKSGAITLKYSKTTETLVKKLNAGRLDCYINDSGAIKASVKSEGIDRSNIVEMATVSTEPVYVGFSKVGWSKYPYAADFMEKLNTAIKALRDSGEIDTIAKNYFAK